MMTDFYFEQLTDPDIREADNMLRACVNCGFCTATCPTYVLLGDELDAVEPEQPFTYDDPGLGNAIGAVNVDTDGDGAHFGARGQK